jgi:sugar phosphate isomerase/epimerase
VLDIEAVWLNPDTVASAYTAGFEAAGMLGAQVIQGIANDDDENRLTDTYAALCEAAAPFGLTVDLEFMAGAKVKSLATCRRVVEASGATNSGLMIDCLHINRCHIPLDTLRQTPAKFLHMLQLCDGPAVAPEGQAAMEEARFARRLPGDGDFDLMAIWKAMPPTIDVSVEAPFGVAAAKLSLVDRARVLKQAADRFFERAGPPGESRTDA